MNSDASLKNRGGWLESLQSLRALAFIGIFISHSGLSSQLGAWGVSAFFVLSGFLMCYSYYDRDVPSTLGASLRFAVNKVSKLYLLHIVMMIIAIPWEIKKTGLDMGIGSIALWLLKIISNLTLTQAWVPTWTVFGSFNGVAWFLSALLFIYFMFPFIIRSIRNIKSGREVLIWSLMIYVAMIVFTYIMRNTIIIGTYPDNCYWTAYTFPILRLGDFVLGCNLGWLYLNKQKGGAGLNEKVFTSIIYSLIEVIAFGAVALSMYIYIKPDIIMGQNWFRYTDLWIPTSLLLVWLFACKKGFLTSVLNNKVMILIGNISSITFLIHNMVIVYFRIIYNHTVGTLLKRTLINTGVSEDIISVFVRIVCCVLALIITLLISFIWKDYIQPRITQRSIKSRLE